ncbi:hypothetical protein C8Q74DRAFT_1366136 [Fomes fomentarius]|nr:hypothetical protein C8Q74DRAFT_1366136 [Fomes fomentarius]
MSNTSISYLSLYFADLVETYAATALSAIFWYEYTITLDKEIYLFWNKKITGATILFFVNRYFTLFYMMYAFPWLPFSMKYEYIPWGAFSALRMYALSGGNLTMALVVLLLSLVTSITAVIYIPFWIFSRDPDWGCEYTYSLSLEAQEIAQLLLNIFYFIALFIIGDAFNALGVNSLAGIFTNPLTTILVSRFLMDLQETGAIGVELNASGPVEDIQSEDGVQADSAEENVSV